MHIWIIKIGEPLPFEESERKMRTWLMAESFARNNDSVLWWTSTFNHFRKEKFKTRERIIAIKKNFHVYMLPSIGYKKNVSIRRYIDHLIVAKMFKLRSIKYERPDVIITSTPSHHLAYEAIVYAKKNGIAVILDVRDPWPDSFLDYFSERYKKFVKRLLFYDFHIIKYCAINANAITAVSHALLAFGLSYANREKTENDLVFYNGYEIPQEKFYSELTNSPVNKLESLKGNFFVIYLGGFSAFHDPSIFLEIANSFTNLKIQFILAGKGEKYHEIEKRSKKMENIHLLGWLNNTEIAKLISYGHIGIAPTNFNTSVLPNKAIIYLSAGLPVISAFKGDLSYLIDKYAAGINYEPGDSSAVKNAIFHLYRNQPLFNQMSKNALMVYNKYFKSSLIYENYYQFVKNFHI